MNENEEYIPIGERINQDVMHDNFVPKYSGLASVRPSLLILTGVWLIFAPMAVGGVLFGVGSFSQANDLMNSLVFSLMPFLAAILAVVILYVQTSRYLNREQEEANAEE